MNSYPTSGNASIRFPQALTFTVGMNHYGVDLLQVQEIRCWSPVTGIPHAPPHMLGVLNLRGTVVPILDLRIRFGLHDPAYTPNNVIIVLSIDTAEGTRGCGLVVDSVSDVIGLPAEAVMPPPAVRGGEIADCVNGLISTNEQLIALLDIGSLVGGELLAARPQPSH